MCQVWQPLSAWAARPQFYLLQSLWGTVPGGQHGLTRGLPGSGLCAVWWQSCLMSQDGIFQKQPGRVWLHRPDTASSVPCVRAPGTTALQAASDIFKSPKAGAKRRSRGQVVIQW